MLGERMSLHSWLAMAVTLTGIAISILAKETDSASRRTRLKLKLPLRGVLFGIGAGTGQGAGLVLSKIGLDHYVSSLPEDVSSQVLFAMPFAGTFIRAALRNGSGMRFALLATIFGPFIGVSLSLMAVEYAKAGIASTLMALTPVLIIVPYSLIYKQKIKFQEVLGTMVTIAGVAMFFLD